MSYPFSLFENQLKTQAKNEQADAARFFNQGRTRQEVLSAVSNMSRREIPFVITARHLFLVSHQQNPVDDIPLRQFETIQANHLLKVRHSQKYEEQIKIKDNQSFLLKQYKQKTIYFMTLFLQLILVQLMVIFYDLRDHFRRDHTFLLLILLPLIFVLITVLICSIFINNQIIHWNPTELQKLTKVNLVKPIQYYRELHHIYKKQNYIMIGQIVICQLVILIKIYQNYYGLYHQKFQMIIIYLLILFYFIQLSYNIGFLCGRSKKVISSVSIQFKRIEETIEQLQSNITAKDSYYFIWKKEFKDKISYQGFLKRLGLN